MRRLQIEAGLVVLWLLASGVFGYASGPKKPVRVAPGAQQTAGVDLSGKFALKPFAREVSGWGESLEDAEQDALKRARKELKEFFHEEGVALSWPVPTDYVSHRLVKSLEKGEPKEFENIGMVREVRLRVELSARDYDDIIHRDRQFISQNRMILLGKMLAGMVAFLAAVSGYFRLEEATKGYYTLWLRLATAGFVAAVGVGLWLIA